MKSLLEQASLGLRFSFGIPFEIDLLRAARCFELCCAPYGVILWQCPINSGSSGGSGNNKIGQCLPVLCMTACKKQQMSIGVALFRLGFAWTCVDADIDHCVDGRINLCSFATFEDASGLHGISWIPNILALELSPPLRLFNFPPPLQRAVLGILFPPVQG